MTEQSSFYHVLLEQPGGETYVNVLRQRADGGMETMFRSYDGETVVAKGPFAGAPEGDRFVDAFLNEAMRRQGTGFVLRAQTPVAFGDAEIRTLMAA